MKYNIIGSSSKGNAIIVEDFLLLDCGVSYTKLKKYLKNIKLIFISHHHKDHLLLTTIKKIAYCFPNMRYLTGSSDVVNRLVNCGVYKGNIYYIKTFPEKPRWYDLGLLKIKLEPLKHDVFNYSLKWEYKGKLGLYAVDTQEIQHIEAKKYDLYLIEANYKEEILKKHLLTCSEEEKVYLQRVPNTHLSWEKANDFLINNMGKNSEYQYIHQSDYNFMEE